MLFSYYPTTCSRCGRKHLDGEHELVSSVGDSAMTLLEAQLSLRRDAPRPGVHEDGCPCRWCEKNRKDMEGGPT